MHLSPEQWLAIGVLLSFAGFAGWVTWAEWRTGHWSTVRPTEHVEPVVEAPAVVVAPEPLVVLPPGGVATVARPGEMRLVFYDLWDGVVGEEWVSRYVRRPTVIWTAPDGASAVAGTTAVYMANREDADGTWHYRWVERCH